ncbi:alpha-(1,3)-fucosyltransferase C [Nasonia vitripennis]|uniref:Fucosyltransferase n=1 Tax=Nasonia vitripennis TaxID=7425 RepID=A0A7M7G8S3_NASVI|nr:alpha-(1,3)-fucosyltransferase C [Nasonia vitripennis]
MARTRCFFGAFALSIGLCLCTLAYVWPRTVSTLAAFAFAGAGVPAGYKSILYWNTFFGDESFYMGEGYVARHCPRYNNCYATHSRSLQNVEDFDAVIFHGINNQLDVMDVPAQRRPEQRYVFVALESPANRYISDEFDGWFNLTMTYQLDSDVVWTYADVVAREVADSQRSQAEDARLSKLIRGKRKLAVWYRSNCETRSRRESYVEELERYVPVAKYGQCSEEPGCPKNQDCFKSDVEPNYFFYLSFENSLCKDYVTEKFFNALKYNVVPVVYGGANYSRFAPPKSYIDALDFETPKDLAEYLVRLSRNETEYKSYFDWKRLYGLSRPTKRVVCDLCELLNAEQWRKKYTISKWYSIESCPLQRLLSKQISSGGPDYASKKTLSFTDFH